MKRLKTKLMRRKELFNKEMDFEMLNYLLDNVKNWYEFPQGDKPYEIK